MTGGEAQDRPQGGVAPRATATWVLDSGTCGNESRWASVWVAITTLGRDS